MSIARKILENQRLTDEERTELRRNLNAVLEEMSAIFSRERRRAMPRQAVNAVGRILEQK